MSSLTGLRVGDAPERWRALGFTVAGSSVQLGGVVVELGAPGRGIISWRLRGVAPMTTLDGLVTEVSDEPPGAEAVSHPNGAVGLDHVVVITPNFARTAEALERAAMPLRRIREAPGGVRQGFRRLGPAILEVVATPDVAAAPDPGEGPPDPGEGPARFWGLVVIVSDLEALAERLGDRLGPVKPAVQRGRRIATLRPSAGLGPAVAFMTPETDP